MPVEGCAEVPIPVAALILPRNSTDRSPCGKQLNWCSASYASLLSSTTHFWGCTCPLSILTHPLHEVAALSASTTWSPGRVSTTRVLSQSLWLYKLGIEEVNSIHRAYFHTASLQHLHQYNSIEITGGGQEQWTVRPTVWKVFSAVPKCSVTRTSFIHSLYFSCFLSVSLLEQKDVKMEVQPHRC